MCSDMKPEVWHLMLFIGILRVRTFELTCQLPCELSPPLIINNATVTIGLWLGDTMGSRWPFLSVFFFLSTHTTKWPQYINRSWKGCWSMEENFLPLRLSSPVCFGLWNKFFYAGRERIWGQAGTDQEEKFEFNNSRTTRVDKMSEWL